MFDKLTMTGLRETLQSFCLNCDSFDSGPSLKDSNPAHPLIL